MKKILFLFCAVLMIGAAVNSQIRVDVKKTITATDTATLTSVGDDVVAIQYTYVETSGTSAGKVYIEGTIDNVAWKHIDSSLSLTDVATAQSVHIAVTATIYQNYRARCTNTSSATATIYFNALRRPDDRTPEPLPMAALWETHDPANTSHFKWAIAPWPARQSKYMRASYSYSGSVGWFGMRSTITAKHS